MLYYDKFPKESRWQELTRGNSFERQLVNMGRPTSAVHGRSNNQVAGYSDEKLYTATGGGKFMRPTSSYGSKGKATISTAAATNPQYNATLMSQKYRNSMRQAKFNEVAKKNGNPTGVFNSQGSIQTLKNSVQSNNLSKTAVNLP